MEFHLSPSPCSTQLLLHSLDWSRVEIQLESYLSRSVPRAANQECANLGSTVSRSKLKLHPLKQVVSWLTLLLNDAAQNHPMLFAMLIFRIHWKSCFQPRIKTSKKRVDILPTILHQFLRHTGAGRFMRSSTVCYDAAVSRNFVEMVSHFIARDPDRSWQFRLCFRPSLWIPRVDKRKRLATIHTLFNFVHSNSGCFHLASLSAWQSIPYSQSLNNATPEPL